MGRDWAGGGQLEQQPRSSREGWEDPCLGGRRCGVDAAGGLPWFQAMAMEMSQAVHGVMKYFIMQEMFVEMIKMRLPK